MSVCHYLWFWGNFVSMQGRRKDFWSSEVRRKLIALDNSFIYRYFFKILFWGRIGYLWNLKFQCNTIEVGKKPLVPALWFLCTHHTVYQLLPKLWTNKPYNNAYLIRYYSHESWQLTKKYLNGLSESNINSILIHVTLSYKSYLFVQGLT